MPVKIPRLFTLDAHCALPTHLQMPGISLASPATAVMQDFRLHHASVVDPDTSVDEAKHSLGISHMTAMLVVQNGLIRGAVSETTLSEQSIIRHLSKGLARDELKVRDVMIPRHRLTAMTYSDIAGLTVGKIITLLETEAVPFVLVVDDSRHEIIGLLCANELSELLDLDIQAKHLATFTDIFNAVIR